MTRVLTNRKSIQRRRCLRRGTTLLEVLVAAALLALALSGLYQLMRMGTRAALRAALESEASLRCESILNQLAIDPQAPSRSQALLIPDDAWSPQIQQLPAPHPDLVHYSVKVIHREHPELGSFEMTRMWRASLNERNRMPLLTQGSAVSARGIQAP